LRPADLNRSEASENQRKQEPNTTSFNRHVLNPNGVQRVSHQPYHFGLIEPTLSSFPNQSQTRRRVTRVTNLKPSHSLVKDINKQKIETTSAKKNHKPTPSNNHRKPKRTLPISRFQATNTTYQLRSRNEANQGHTTCAGEIGWRRKQR